MAGYVTVLYTSTCVKAALVEASTSRVAVERICESVGLRGVDVKWIFEEEMSVGGQEPPILIPEDTVALINDTSDGWLYPKRKEEGDDEQTFLIVRLDRGHELFLDLHLINATSAFEALLDSDAWSEGAGLRAHMKAVNASIDGTTSGLTYMVFTLDGIRVDLKTAREAYNKQCELLWDR